MKDVYKNLRGTTESNFSVGIKSEKIDIVPDRTNRIIRAFNVSFQRLAFEDYNREPRFTGLVAGGSLSAGSNSSEVSVSAGHGIIVDVTNPEDIVLTNVSWGDSILSLPLTANQLETFFIYVNSSGIDYTTIQPSTDLLQDRIYLGYVISENQNIIKFCSYPYVSSQIGKKQNDCSLHVPDTAKISGFTVYPAKETLEIYVKEGKVYQPGSSWHSSPKQSDFKEIPAVGTVTNPATFAIVKKSGELYATDQTVIPKIWESAGSVLNLSGTEATIHYLYSSFPNLYLQLGTSNFPKFRDAFLSLDKDLENHVAAPPLGIPNNSVLLAQIIISKQALDFNDKTLALIVQKSQGETGDTISGVDTTLVPQYKLRAIADEDILPGDELSMDINGHFRKYPATGGEDESQFSTDPDITMHSMTYMDFSYGAVAWVTNSHPDTVITRTGQYGLSNTVGWSDTQKIGFTTNIVRLRVKHVLKDIYVILVVLDNGQIWAYLCKRDHPNSPIVGHGASLELPNNHGQDVDSVWDKERENLIFAYCDHDEVYNDYGRVDVQHLNLNLYRHPVYMTRRADRVMCTTEGSDIIILSLYQATHRSRVCEKAWSNHHKYDRSAGCKSISTSAELLCGIIQKNGYMYAQVRETGNKLQTYKLRFVSGQSIYSPSNYGFPLDGKSGCLIRTASGNIYSVVYNLTDRVDIYEGGVNINLYEKVYTTTKSFANSPCEIICATFFNNRFAYMVSPNTDVMGYVYFIDSSVTRTDHFIAVARSNVSVGEYCDADIALPIIVLPREYSPGAYYYYGPYKYQVITHNQAVIIIEATEMMGA